MPVTMTAADFWELRCRTLEANAAIEQLKQQALRIEVARDALIRRMAQTYGFDADQPFVLDDADLSLTQGSL